MCPGLGLLIKVDVLGWFLIEKMNEGKSFQVTNEERHKE